MMSKADLVIMRLDVDLLQAHRNAGILMGPKLFAALAKRDLIKMEDFGLLGTRMLLERIPAYGKTHAVWRQPQFGDWDFQVGGLAKVRGPKPKRRVRSSASGSPSR